MPFTSRDKLKKDKAGVYFLETFPQSNPFSLIREQVPPHEGRFPLSYDEDKFVAPLRPPCNISHELNYPHQGYSFSPLSCASRICFSKQIQLLLLWHNHVSIHVCVEYKHTGQLYINLSPKTVKDCRNKSQIALVLKIYL